MLFNSFAFAVFLPIVFLLYWALPHKFRWILLLVSSYYFYMSWNVKYISLILFTTIISYSAAKLIEKAVNRKWKKCILTGTAIICFGVLFFFKYFNFASKSIVNVLSLFMIHINPITLNLLLPVGISFYTFQTLSYVIDVYKEEVPAEHHFGYYAVFISFFPQLVAGPIERTGNLLPQIKAEHKFDYDQATYGLKLMAWGYFKKIVVADTLSQYVSVVYNSPRKFQGFVLVLASVFFAIQIYCDFSGYSDIAIGTAKLLGINLTTNFRSPYFSQSVKEFWSRWHISLSTWFRDYVYIPLGGNRVGTLRCTVNLLVTFLISGLWHGANWTFVIWGGVHGGAQILEKVLVPKKYKKSNGLVWFLRVAIIFAFCTVAWIFFISDSVGDAVYVISNLTANISDPVLYLQKGFWDIGMGKVKLLVVLFCLLLLTAFDFISLKRDIFKEIGQKPLVVRYIAYIFLLCMILFFRATVQAEFVYFQF